MELGYYDVNAILGISLIKMEDFGKRHHFWQPWLDTEETKSQKHQSKWKNRRSRLPEYSRKEAKSPEGLENEGQNEVTRTDAPLDMSLRHRGLPPSYEKTISNPDYKGYRPSVIVNEARGARNELPSGISMCDPIIDEHFRRSLGKDYKMLFETNSNNNKNEESSNVQKEVAVKEKEIIRNSTVQELIDMDNGLTVDDHFAKALGDTWFKLNQKEQPEIKNSNNKEKTAVSL